MITHVKLDLVGHSVISEIDQENFYRGAGKDTRCTGSSSKKRIFYAIRRHIVIHPNPNAHGVDLGRVMEVDDHLTNHLVVRNIEVDVVVGAQPGGAPVDLHDFSEALAYLQPVAYFVRSIDLQGDAGNDPAE